MNAIKDPIQAVATIVGTEEHWRLRAEELYAARVEITARAALNFTADALASIRDLMQKSNPATDVMSEIEEDLGIAQHALTKAHARALAQVRGMLNAGGRKG